MNIEALEKLAALEEQAESILIGPSTGRTTPFVATRQQRKDLAAIVARIAAAEAKRTSDAVPTEPDARRSAVRPKMMTIVGQALEQRVPLKLLEIKPDLVKAAAKATGRGVVARAGFVKITAQPDPKADKRKAARKRESAE